MMHLLICGQRTIFSVQIYHLQSVNQIRQHLYLRNKGSILNGISKKIITLELLFPNVFRDTDQTYLVTFQSCLDIVEFDLLPHPGEEESK